jgi:DNA-binding NarL/FixJ family response regulator
MTDMATVMLADDHPSIRHCLRQILENTSDLTILGETGDGSEVVEMVVRLRPDVLVLDLEMPGINSLQITQQIVARSLQTHVVICSSDRCAGYVVQAMRNGASAYVVKDFSVGDLAQAVRQAASGEHYFSPALREGMGSLYDAGVASEA